MQNPQIYPGSYSVIFKRLKRSHFKGRKSHFKKVGLGSVHVFWFLTCKIGKGSTFQGDSLLDRCISHFHSGKRDLARQIADDWTTTTVAVCRKMTHMGCSAIKIGRIFLEPHAHAPFLGSLVPQELVWLMIMCESNTIVSCKPCCYGNNHYMVKWGFPAFTRIQAFTIKSAHIKLVKYNYCILRKSDFGFNCKLQIHCTVNSSRYSFLLFRQHSFNWAKLKSERKSLSQLVLFLNENLSGKLKINLWSSIAEYFWQNHWQYSIDAIPKA